MTVARRSDARAEFYGGLLVTASSAVRDWADTDFIDPDTLVVRAMMVDGELGEPVTVTVDHIARGWQALVKLERDGRYHHCQEDLSVRKAERSLSNRDGDEDYDPCMADAALQMAIYGELIRG